MVRSLLMSPRVKNDDEPYRRRAGQSRISAKHQVTIPLDAFTEAGLQPGDAVRIRAIGPGQVVLTRHEDLLAEFSGALASGGELRRALDQSRAEWD